MSGEDHGMSHHPAPHRDRVALWESGLGLAGGPLAWLVQLTAGYALVAAPCFTGLEPDPAGDGRIGAIVIYLLCLALALAGGLVSLRIYRRTRDETESSENELLEGGRGRTRFLALWGVLLGFGFAVVILLNGIPLIGVPSCAL
jgi:hypothetical protein